MTATTFAPGLDTSLAPVGAVATDAPATVSGVRTRSKAVRVLIGFGLVAGVIGAVLLGAGSYTHDLVRDQLVAQQISFPPADSPGMTAAEYPGLQQYGGQLVDDGPKAKAWAEQFMTPHILALSSGMPYGIYSAKAFQTPQDQEMAGISKQMALGEVQRGLLLSAWGWWTVGTVTWTTGLVLVVLGGLLLIGAATIVIRLRR